MKKYMEKKINRWYENAHIDYDIEGKFINATMIGNDLEIIWDEMGQKYRMVIYWATEYAADDLYNIWMEQCGEVEEIA